EIVAEDEQQRRRRIDVHGVRRPVHLQQNLAHQRSSRSTPQKSASANAVSAVPEGISTYWRPSTMYVMAPAYSEDPVWKCHRFLPAFASNAIRLPDPPAKTSPDAVDSTPAHDWLA